MANNPRKRSVRFALLHKVQTRTGSLSTAEIHALFSLICSPYNSGHLLVCTYRHVASYEDTTLEEAAEMAALSKRGMEVLRKVSRAQGFNLGMNQGELAGAGIAEHLHQHIVPRWSNDANFFPIIAQTKAIPRLLGEVRAEIQKAWLDS